MRWKIFLDKQIITVYLEKGVEIVFFDILRYLEMFIYVQW